MFCHLVAVHIYTQTIHRTTQITTNVEECGPCLVFVSFTLAFALQLRKIHRKTLVKIRKTSVRLRKTSVREKNLRVEKPQSERKTSVREKNSSPSEKPQSEGKTSVREKKPSQSEKPQSERKT